MLVADLLTEATMVAYYGVVCVRTEIRTQKQLHWHAITVQSTSVDTSFNFRSSQPTAHSPRVQVYKYRLSRHSLMTR